MELRFRDAGESDLAAIVRLLVDDDIASERDDASEPLAAEYGKAFEDMSAQGLPAQELYDLVNATLEKTRMSN